MTSRCCRWTCTSQRTVAALVDRRRRTRNTAVVFVTHEINPVLPYVDRVIYLAGGRFRIGSVDEVLTSQTLSDLYGQPIDVIRSRGRILVAGIPESTDLAHHGPTRRGDDERCAGRWVRPDIWHQIFNFADYGELLALVHNSIIAGADSRRRRRTDQHLRHDARPAFRGARDQRTVLRRRGRGAVAGRQRSSRIAGRIASWRPLLIGSLGSRARDRNSIIGVLMPFGLGLGVLFLALYKGRAANKFGLLTGQIVAVDNVQLSWLVGTSIVVLVGLIVCGDHSPSPAAIPRSPPPEVCPSAGSRRCSCFCLGLTVAMSVQVVGALLVLSIACTPAAAAMRVTASPRLVTVLSVVFAVVSMVGGILLALGSSIPISPYVTTISFTIYVVCRIIGAQRGRRGWQHHPRRGSRSLGPLTWSDSTANSISRSMTTKIFATRARDGVRCCVGRG